MDFFIGLIVGLVIGGFIGIGIAALVSANGRDDGLDEVFDRIKDTAKAEAKLEAMEQPAIVKVRYMTDEEKQNFLNAWKKLTTRGLIMVDKDAEFVDEDSNEYRNIIQEVNKENYNGKP